MASGGHSRTNWMQLQAADWAQCGPLQNSPGQYGDVDVLAEMLVRGHGLADLVGEGWPLVWGG